MDTQQSVVIAVDAMGGDHAPDSVIAGVKSAEKQYSDVHFLIFGDEEKCATTFEAIKNAAGFIRKELSVAFSDLRSVPALEFRLDTSMQYSSKIESILEDIKNGGGNGN